MPPLPPDQARWFAEEIKPHEPALRSYLRNRFPKIRDVDDLIQEAYLRIFRAKNPSKVEHLRSYLFTIARNVALDQFRRHRDFAPLALENFDLASVLEEGPDAAENASYKQEVEILTDAIRSLPPRCQEVVTLRRIHGLSYREIADKLGISEHTVNAQLAIGIIRCRDYLRAKGILNCHSDAARTS